MIPTSMIIAIITGRGFAYDHSQRVCSHFR